MAEEQQSEEVQRWTAKRRSARVISLLKGETTAVEAARRHGLKVAEVEEWRERFLAVVRARQRILFHCDCRRARVFNLVRLERVELDVFAELRRKIGLGINGVHRTYVHAGGAINAFIRVNDYLILQFVETSDRTYFCAVGKLASVAAAAPALAASI